MSLKTDATVKHLTGVVAELDQRIKALELCIHTQAVRMVEIERNLEQDKPAQFDPARTDKRTREYRQWKNANS